MEQELRIIYEAQQIDTQIAENERKTHSVPKTIEELDNEIDELKNKIEKEKVVAQELEKEKNKKEKDLDVEKDKIKKFESKLHEIKTNKEYQALLKEIETVKETNDRTEEEVLVLMDKIEELKKDYETSEKYLKSRKVEVEKEKNRLKAELDVIEKTIHEFKEARNKLLSAVSDNLRATYNTLIEKRSGTAVVNLKNGVCLGCFMNIPPQLFIEATKNRQLILCPSCNRIFYFLEDE
ncbi:MAG: C4-type zinc ribbon domain-containing protein [Proteobacteria bacterium]|nr:C4-type zinc ribbon domain-containing protein [Pseudomonadota bacterium]